jgi:hypothetical protein
MSGRCVDPILSASERAVVTARRKAAYEALHPETKHGGNRRVSSAQVGHLNPVDRFTAETAAKTGRSETSIKRDAERGSKVCQAALDVLEGTKADTGTALDLPPNGAAPMVIVKDLR